jgi:hypothetical protein
MSPEGGGITIQNNTDCDRDPRDGYISYRKTTACKPVQVHLDGKRVETVHTCEGCAQPFEHFSAELANNQLTSLALISASTGVIALASCPQAPVESYRDRKEFLWGG